MSAQHTPGPWRVEGHSGLLGGALAGHAITHGVNAYQDGPAGYVCKTVGTTDADARLIAAAPDMLAALLQLHKLIDFDDQASSYQWTFDDVTAINAAMTQARDAIRKATQGA